MRPLGLQFGAVAAGFALACGEPGPELEVGFSTHRLECEVRDLQAWLQVSGVDGFCPLEVLPDRTIQGVCGPVPGRAERVFSILYYVFLPNFTGVSTQVDLARASLAVDLTEETREEVPVDFGAATLVTSFDADLDGLSNLVEVCRGTDPLDPNSPGG